MIKYTINKEVKVARISNSSGRIEVCPEFETYSYSAKLFILKQLQNYGTYPHDIYLADIEAFKYMSANNPETNFRELLSELAKILSYAPTDLNIKRLEKIKEFVSQAH